MNDIQCFIMGLPEAGKTTYLAALWYYLWNNNDSTLKIKSIIGDQSYISKISKDWSDAQEIGRTKPSFEQKSISLILESETNNSIKFTFPDLSGETFQYQYERREAKKEHIEAIRNCTGILIFVNPSKIIDPCLISQVAIDLRTEDEDQESYDLVVYNPRNDPTQVQLVELMQFVAYIRDNLAINTSLVISAWDLVEKNYPSGINPEHYLKKHMPLLWQYIVSNNQSFITSFYGISAQGGELGEKEKLLDMPSPCDRIKVVNNSGEYSKDILLPFSEIVSK